VFAFRGLRAVVDLKFQSCHPVCVKFSCVMWVSEPYQAQKQFFFVCMIQVEMTDLLIVIVVECVCILIARNTDEKHKLPFPFSLNF
jgi:hypothetical protein